MKKIIFGLIVLSAIASAKEVVPTPTTAPEIVPTMTVPEVYPVLRDRNIYFRVGGDLYTQYNDISYDLYKLADTTADGFGFEAALEYTKISKSGALELGLGIAYQSHAGFKSVDGDILHYSADSPDKNYIENYYSGIDSFDSIPVYVTAKYNFPALYNNLIPYIKADGGYSINIGENGTFQFDYMEPDVSETTVGKGDTKLTNGAYAGLGAGIQYDDFTIDLMFKMNTGKVKSTVDYITYPNGSPSTPTDSGSFSFKENVVNYRATLSIGYRFNF